MTQRIQQTQPQDSDFRPKWFNSPVTVHIGSIAEIREHIPSFERRAFGLTQFGKDFSRLNERLDTIVRLPLGEDDDFIPIGVVSKNYALVQHTDVLEVAKRALENAEIAVEDVKAEVSITEYAERMALSLYLPDKYGFDPGDGLMPLRLECINSVEGSTRFRTLMGWFRFVCSNGLIVGVTSADVRRRHVGDIQIDDVATFLIRSLAEAKTEKKNFERWCKTEINLPKVSSWTEKTVRKTWGFKAAARTYHIASSGFDVDIVGQYKNNSPTTIGVHQKSPVPGAPRRCRNLFDLSQILAWLAKERRDLQEQLEWRERIPKLMEALNK